MIDFKDYADDPQNKKYWNDLRKYQNNFKIYLLLILFIVSCIAFAYVIGDLAVHMRLE